MAGRPRRMQGPDLSGWGSLETFACGLSRGSQQVKAEALEQDGVADSHVLKETGGTKY